MSKIYKYKREYITKSAGIKTFEQVIKHPALKRELINKTSDNDYYIYTYKLTYDDGTFEYHNQKVLKYPALKRELINKQEVDNNIIYNYKVKSPDGKETIQRIIQPKYTSIKRKLISKTKISTNKIVNDSLISYVYTYELVYDDGTKKTQTQTIRHFK
jgi:hypothetical protein